MTRRKSTVRPGAGVGRPKPAAKLMFEAAKEFQRQAAEIKRPVDQAKRDRVKRTRESEARKIAQGGMRLPGVVLDAAHAAMLRDLAALHGGLAPAIRFAIKEAAERLRYAEAVAVGLKGNQGKRS
jgi:hypothetical protein